MQWLGEFFRDRSSRGRMCWGFGLIAGGLLCQLLLYPGSLESSGHRAALVATQPHRGGFWYPAQSNLLDRHAQERVELDGLMRELDIGVGSDIELEPGDPIFVVIDPGDASVIIPVGWDADPLYRMSPAADWWSAFVIFALPLMLAGCWPLWIEVSVRRKATGRVIGPLGPERTAGRLTGRNGSEGDGPGAFVTKR